MLEDKQTKKSKGFAFVEFLDSASIQNALKMHHQTFMKRRINVELTAGGGGKSVNRIEKIRVKNDKHREQVSVITFVILEIF